MTQKQNLNRLLLAGLVALSIAGVLIHTAVHPISKNSIAAVPIISGFLSIIVVPLLFSFRKTVQYGYVLNGMLVIIGAVTMAHFSIVKPPSPFTFTDIFFKTTFIDILLLVPKFCIGKALFDMEMFGADSKHEIQGIWYRYPNLGWWGVHLVSISIVYTAGNIIWRAL